MKYIHIYTYLHVLADGVVEDLSILRHPIELDLLGVQDEFAYHHRLVLGRVARGRQEFLRKKKRAKKKQHTEKQVTQKTVYARKLAHG